MLDILPPIVLKLPRVHSVAISVDPGYHRIYDNSLPSRMPLLCLKELDLEVCARDISARLTCISDLLWLLQTATGTGQSESHKSVAHASCLCTSPCVLPPHAVDWLSRQQCTMPEFAQHEIAIRITGWSHVQNCGQETLPAALGADSRLRQLRITDVRYRPIYFEKDDLDTLSSMSSLTFLSFTQARLDHDKCGSGC